MPFQGGGGGGVGGGGGGGRISWQWIWFVNFTWLSIIPDFSKLSPWKLSEPRHEISNNVVCATSKASDQPVHMHSLIRVFASPLNILWVQGYWLNIIWSLQLKRRLYRLILVYTCQNATLLEITCHGSNNFVWKGWAEGRGYWVNSSYPHWILHSIWGVGTGHEKTNNVDMRHEKTQISLGINSVWSVFTVCMKKVLVSCF